MIRLILKPGETGYDAVDEYVLRYWQNTGFTDVALISLEISYDGEHFYHVIDVANPYNDGNIEFDYDWWEGERYINILGIKNLSEINIDGEGLYRK